MLLVVLGFVLKLSFHGWPGILATAMVAAVATAMLSDVAAGQSRTQIAAWLEQPSLMLDTSVVLTIDVLAQIAFCVLCSVRMAGGSLTRGRRVLLAVLLWFPGLLVFPVLFSALVELIFSCPGADFGMLGLCAAAAVAVGAPLMSWGMRVALPEPDMRLELLFLLNVLIAALGVVATVNGRTAVRGTSSVEWGALATVVALIAVGATAGMVLYKRRIRNGF